MSSPRLSISAHALLIPSLALGLASAFPQKAAALTPILEYQFNTFTNNVTPVSAGSLAAGNATVPNLTIYGDDGVTPTNRLTAPGASGLSGDLALAKLTASTAKGVAKFVGDIPQLDNLSSFTLTFWFNGTNVAAGSDRLFLYGGNDGGAAGAFELEANAGGGFNIKISNSTQFITNTTVFVPNTLTFIALTYDGTAAGVAATNNVKIYSGTTTTFNQTPTQFSSTVGTLPNPTVPQLLLGNRSDGTRGAGYDLDDITVFGNKTNASGALGASDLQAIYSAGLQNLSVTAVPEPTTASLLGLSAVGLLARRRRVL